jgi:NAD(P)-dependent dehydrogenase (short-subunit alcohol dehydrogenase family)
MISFAKNKTNARLASEFYLNAINVMKGAEGVSNYMGLSDREAFNVEYWSLEEDKLKRLPKPKPLSGKVALITGASGAIGKASARKLLENGTTVFLTDINKKALNKIIIDLKNEFTADNVSGCPIDVTNEASVKKCFNALLDIFGGIDILISSVGINTEASFEETTLSLWNKNFSVLSTGYFLVAKESFKIMKNQSKGGSIIFVVSKNGMIPSNKVSSYCSAKAAEIQLSRCIALEGAKYDIRSNVVNPDAVIKESNLWTDELKSKRSRTYNIKISELENYYKNRSLLKKSVYGKDIAEAIYHFCLETSQKSTGNILNVDAGHVATFSR